MRPDLVRGQTVMHEFVQAIVLLALTLVVTLAAVRLTELEEAYRTRNEKIGNKD
jgi:hypothetical protein